MTDYDTQLQQLVLQAQRYSTKIVQHLMLTHLICSLKQSGKLTRPKLGSFRGMYEAIYKEALQRLFFYIFSISKIYVPQKEKVLKWINFIWTDFLEAIRDVLLRIPKRIKAKQVTCLSIEELLI
ncbi:MAG: hypothetical protein AAGD25_36700 [Cyanobacteria bacterium P01_F01_bin.150]